MAKNEEEFDVCVSCGKVTSYKKTDDILKQYFSGNISTLTLECTISMVFEMLKLILIYYET